MIKYIDELLEEISMYGFPKEKEESFSLMQFCIDHCKWLQLIKRHYITIGSFKQEKILFDMNDFSVSEHIADGCTLISNQRSLVDVYNTLITLKNRGEEK